MGVIGQCSGTSVAASARGNARRIVIAFPGAARGSVTLIFHDTHEAMQNGAARARFAGLSPSMLGDTVVANWSPGASRTHREHVADCFR